MNAGKEDKDKKKKGGKPKLNKDLESKDSDSTSELHTDSSLEIEDYANNKVFQEQLKIKVSAAVKQYKNSIRPILREVPDYKTELDVANATSLFDCYL